MNNKNASASTAFPYLPTAADAAQPASAAPAALTPHALAYRPDIDGLRALAVTLVLLFHAFPDVLRGGFIGVDVFFVISGFLITGIIIKSLDAGSFSFSDFYARRIARIFPALLLVLASVYVLGWVLLPADEYARLGNHITAGAGFFSNVTYWKESGYFDVSADSKPLLHLWSLAIEEQFYIVWPLALWAVARKRKAFAAQTVRTRTLLLLAVLVAVVSFGLNLRGIYTRNDVAGLYYSPQTRFWELLVGAVLAVLHVRGLLRQEGARCVIVGWMSAAAALAVIGAAVFLSSASAFPGWWALVPTLAAAMIIGGGSGGWFNRAVLAHPLVVWLGLISYPLYLWHWPLLSFAHHLAGGVPPASVRFVALVAAAVLAWATRALLEQPLRAWPQRNRVMLLVAGMLIIAAAGAVTEWRQGLPSRYGITELKREVGRYECDDRKKNSGCVFGNPGSGKLVVIYGDSHAEHFTRALDEALGKDYQFYMVTNGSCLMGEKVLRPDVGNQRDCEAARAKLHSLQGRQVYAVIRAQRWHAYGGSDEAGIRALVGDALLAGGLHPQRLIILGSTIDVAYDCEVSNYYSMPLSIRKTCHAEPDYREINQLFASTTRAMQVPANVHFIYPSETICPGGQCQMIHGSVSMYSDQHHLTKDGALKLMPQIAQALQ